MNHNGSTSYPLPPWPGISRNNVLFYWGPLLLWIAIMFAGSGDLLSAQHTGSILVKVWTWTFGAVHLRTFNLVHLLIRKCAHLTEYGVLSALCFRALRGPARGLWHARWMLPALIAPLLIAVTDEWHQSFVPSRTSSSRDVAIDLCGACLAQLVIWTVLRRRRRTVTSF